MRLALPLVVAAALALPATATASFPGANGMLAVTEETCGDSIEITHVQAYTSRGARRGELTPSCDTYESGNGDRIARGTFGPDWSPDGTRLLYAQAAGGDQPARFETVAADGTGEQAVSPALRGVSSVNAPSFAPDGRRFAYLDGGTLYVAPGDGGAAAPLRDARNFLSVRWSPRGDMMAVVRAGTAAQAGLWLVDAASGRLVRRMVKGSVAGFDWSPDGSRIVFATPSYHAENGRVSGGNLYAVLTDGGRARVFVRTRGVGAVNPVWSPDGDSIAWVQMRFTPGDVRFRVIPTLWRKPARPGPARRIAILRSPSVEEGYHSVPDLAWQALPRR